MDKIVEFAEYCYKCRYSDYSEDSEPCCDCLEEPVNEDSHKPVYFKDTTKNKEENK